MTIRDLTEQFTLDGNIKIVVWKDSTEVYQEEHTCYGCNANFSDRVIDLEIDYMFGSKTIGGKAFMQIDVHEEE